MDGPLRRPLALVARPLYKDVERWTRNRKASVPDAVLESLNSDDLRKLYVDQRAPRLATPASVELLAEYQSRDGRRIVTVRYRLAFLKWTEGELGLGVYPNFTFLAAPGKPLRFIGFGLTLIDSGDYDGDGESELLFRYKGGDGDGNEYGYKLLYNRLEKFCFFQMLYH
jgi:hypothetical protein